MPSHPRHCVKSRMSLYAESDGAAETTSGGVATKRKFEEFKVGDEVEAVVVRKTPFGFFCAINAERDVLLDAPMKFRKLLNYKEKLKAKINMIDMEKRQATIILPDLEELVQGRNYTKRKKKSSPSVKMPSQAKSEADSMKITYGTNSLNISGLNIASVNADYDKGIVHISLKSSTDGS